MGQLASSFRVSLSKEDEITKFVNENKCIHKAESKLKQCSQNTSSTNDKSQNRIFSTTTSIRSPRTTKQSPQTSVFSPIVDESSTLPILPTCKSVSKTVVSKLKENYWNISSTLHDSDSIKLINETVLLKNLTKYITNMVSTDTRNPTIPSTKFDAVAIPDITIADYFSRMITFFKCSYTCHIVAIILIKRIQNNHPEFVLDLLNIHRVLLVANVLSAKFFDDYFMYNAYYAQVGGVSCSELNKLEIRFLNLIQYKLYISAQDFQNALDMFI